MLICYLNNDMKRYRYYEKLVAEHDCNSLVAELFPGAKVSA